MRVMDADILSKLEAIEVTTASGVVFKTYDGVVQVDNSGKTVLYPVPYLVYYANLGNGNPDDPQNRRLGGGSFRHSKLFQLTYVGIDRNQAMLAGEKARGVLEGRPLDLGSGRSWRMKVEESQRVRRDDDAIRPDGSPLFYGVDIYTVSQGTNRQGVPT